MRFAVKYLAPLFALLLVACAKPVTKDEVAGLDYGPKPTRYQEEVKSYLAVRLTDPKNAIIEFRSEPAQMYQRKVAFRDMHYGWAVCVWVNDKNSSAASLKFLSDDVLLPQREDRAGQQRPGRFRRRRPVCAQPVRAARRAVQAMSYDPAVALDFFKAAGKPTDVKQAQVIFAEKETNRLFQRSKIYFVLDGEVSLVAGKKCWAACRKGEIFGEMAALTHAPRSATAVAKTDSTLIALDDQESIARSRRRPASRS